MVDLDSRSGMTLRSRVWISFLLNSCVEKMSRAGSLPQLPFRLPGRLSFLAVG